jgi:hypothetical protein
MKKINIVSLYKHNIVHKNTTKIQAKNFIISLVVCIITVFSFIYLGIVNEDVKISTNAFNPISELYRDVEVASFVSGDNVSFIVPIKTEKYVINLDNIEFTSTSSIMIFASCDGVVEDIGNDKYRYIKIKHTNELFSVISNVDIVGVKIGNIVKQGQEIATVKPNSKVYFRIENNGELIKGLYLNKSFIKWK